MNTHFIVDTIRQDVLHGFRLLVRSPLFSVACVLSLALGIGANVAIFTAFEAVLLRTLPVHRPEELLHLSWSAPSVSGGGFSYAGFRRFEALTDTFASALAYRNVTLRVMLNGQTDAVEGALVSGNYHAMLGLRAAAGRLFTPHDDRVPSGHAVAVISYGFWQQQYGGDLAALDQTLVINGKPYRIIGVTPRNFFGLDPARPQAVSLPIMMAADVLERPKKAPAWDAPDAWWLAVVGRLGPGVSAAQAHPRLADVFQQLVDETSGVIANPKGAAQVRQRTLEVGSMSQGVNELRKRFASPMIVVMAVVGLVLLIACANVANLMLARMTTRRREIGVRLAIGASRVRIIQQMLTETFVLACLGAAGGLLMAYSLRDVARMMISEGPAPLALELVPNARVLVFTIVVACVSAAVCSLAPAIRVMRADLTEAMKGAAVASAAGGRFWSAGKLLVAVQIVSCVALLNGAGLFIRTLANLQGDDVGFRAEGVLLFAVNPQGTIYAGPRATLLHQELLQRLAALPGVRAASLAGHSPLSGDNFMANASVEGEAPQPEEHRMVDWNVVGPGFFKTMGTPVMLGREFTQQDHERSTPVAIVNETFVRRFFAGQSPLHRRLRLGRNADAPPLEIVGVVKDVKSASLRDSAPSVVYRPYTQAMNPMSRTTFAVLTNTEATASVRKTVREIDPQIVLSHFRTMSQQVDQSLHRERVLAVLSSSFGLLALILACVGLYGVIAYGVARRTVELSIRRALGAQDHDVRRHVLREGLIVIGLGLAIAVPIVAFSGGLVRNLLYGLKPVDPIAVGTAAGLVIAVGLLASYLPARRASRLHPMFGLRQD